MGQENASRSAYFKVAIVLLFMFGFRFLPPIGDITPYGMAVLGILIGAILGIKFMIGSVEEKAEIKAALVPFIIGCVVVFGAFGIWKIVVTIGNNF